MEIVFRQIFLAALLPPFLSSVSNAEALNCRAVPVAVSADDPDLALRICSTAESAIPKMAFCNVSVTKPVLVRVNVDVPKHHFASYKRSERVIDIASPDVMQAMVSDDSPFFNVAPREFFDSVLVHELSHAAFDEMLCPLRDCTAGAEYVAYAMQIRSLSPKGRSAFEHAAGIERQVSHDEFSAMVYAMAPKRFAAISWTHFTQRPDPCAFIGEIMAGEIIIDVDFP